MKKNYFLFFVQMLIITLTPNLFGVTYPLVEYTVKATNDVKKEIVNKIIQYYTTNNTVNLKNINASEKLGKITIKKKTTSNQGYASKIEYFITITNATPLAVALHIQQLLNKKLTFAIKTFITDTTDLFSKYTIKYFDMNNEHEETPISVVTNNIDLLDIVAKAITENLISTNNVNTPVNTNGDTLLHILSSDDAFLDQVKLLINNNANLEITNKNGEFPLFIADRGGRSDDKNKNPLKSTRIFKFLAEKYEDKKYNLGKVFKIENIPYSPFQLLWTSRDYDIQWYALYNIVQRDEENSPLDGYGNRLLHYFADQDNQIQKSEMEDTVKYILDGDFKDNKKPVLLDFNIKNNSNQTPLDAACKAFNKPMVELFMSKSARLENLDKKTKDLVTTIIKSSDENNPNNLNSRIALLTLFLEYGAKKDGLETTIKNSHEYEHWGPKAKTNLDKVIEIINTTNVDPGKLPPSSSSSPSESPSKVKKNNPPPKGKKIKDPFTENLSTLKKKLRTLKEKLKKLAKNLATLKSNLK
jgi:ankyrin repeat protein